MVAAGFRYLPKWRRNYSPCTWPSTNHIGKLVVQLSKCFLCWNLIQSADYSTTVDPISPTEVVTSIETETSTPEVVIDRAEAIIDISTGRIEGRELVSKVLNKTYHAYQGIPYGQPPIKDLRFRVRRLFL